MAVEFIIVGLGNPGAEYTDTRHNAGFLQIDALAATYNATTFRKKFKAYCATCMIKDTGVLLLKPMTFMNLSGEAVQEALHFYKLSPAHLIVVHDELDLPIGKLRVKLGGGTAGHNGLKSIDGCLNTNNYWRIRLGINRPALAAQVSSYVLSPFAAPDRNLFDALTTQAAKHFSTWFTKGADRFQTDTARAMAALTAPTSACDSAVKLP